MSWGNGKLPFLVGPEFRDRTISTKNWWRKCIYLTLLMLQKSGFIQATDCKKYTICNGFLTPQVVIGEFLNHRFNCIELHSSWFSWAFQEMPQLQLQPNDARLKIRPSERYRAGCVFGFERKDKEFPVNPFNLSWCFLVTQGLEDSWNFWWKR